MTILLTILATVLVYNGIVFAVCFLSKENEAATIWTAMGFFTIGIFVIDLFISKRILKDIISWWAGDIYINENDEFCNHSDDIKNLRYRITMYQYGSLYRKNYRFEELGNLLDNVQSNKMVAFNSQTRKLTKRQRNILINEINDIIQDRKTA